MERQLLRMPRGLRRYRPHRPDVPDDFCLRLSGYCIPWDVRYFLHTQSHTINEVCHCTKQARANQMSERACQSNIGWSSTLAHLILMSYFNIAKELFQKALTGLGLVWYYMSGQEESPQMTVPAVSEDFPRTIIIDALL